MHVAVVRLLSACGLRSLPLHVEGYAVHLVAARDLTVVCGEPDGVRMLGDARCVALSAAALPGEAVDEQGIPLAHTVSAAVMPGRAAWRFPIVRLGPGAGASFDEFRDK